MRILRLLHIIYTLKRYGLYRILRNYHRNSFWVGSINILLFFIPNKNVDKSLSVRTRMALETLGPVFVKFGQLLSTRQDLLPPEYIIELAKLQSQVKPFAGAIAKQIVEASLKCKLTAVFSEFSDEAVASASIAQVHKAVLRDTQQTVAVKILRPAIAKTIAQDLDVLYLIAWFIEKIFHDGKRLKPREVINEFKKNIFAELNFTQEAANAAELRRLHTGDPKIIIPEVFYDYSSNEIIVFEWMDGIPITDLKALKAQQIDLEQLSYHGVAIFYTQVFDYGFFHADMHPGNILCDTNGRYIALDFGIVGCLAEEDKRYLAINILAFFNRDYKKVALTHIESGWAPADTAVEELENAIRAVCEPIFNKPLAQISFGQFLVRLFQVSRRFGITVQPQLLLLQKTIVNVEGLGRVLNPNLDLWVTAKPILERWMKKQMGLRGFLANLKAELPYWAYLLPKIPRDFATSLVTINALQRQNQNYLKLSHNYKQQNRILFGIVFLLLIILFIKIL